jgi:hypothetical protein
LALPIDYLVVLAKDQCNRLLERLLTSANVSAASKQRVCARLLGRYVEVSAECDAITIDDSCAIASWPLTALARASSKRVSLRPTCITRSSL